MRAASLCFTVAADHPALAGHFPGLPIVPGVLLLDEALHALQATLLATNTHAPAALTLHSVKFHRPVRPQEILQLRYDTHANGSTQFELFSGETRVLSATLARGSLAP